jgi:hypothetical protein
MSQKLICSHSRVKGWQSTSNRKSMLTDRKANEAYAPGPSLALAPSKALGGALAMP